VINADDYYGHEAFQLIYEELLKAEDDDKFRWSMVGFDLAQTITENGYVSRGVCETDDEGFLTGITERTMIMPRGDEICFSEDKGETWSPLAKDTIVSMNFWGFTKSLMDEMVARFPAFLDKALAEDPLKGEYFLPSIPDILIKEGKATVKVLSSKDKWYGVTYKEDRDDVVSALQSMKDKGLYPEKLWK
ncbi:MAG: nucleotidyltransferase, partial [Firmicutes bacterium]|nr:nucleotidyltransferase [Bacillota bacterium]